jgi:hypothetical protein
MVTSTLANYQAVERRYEWRRLEPSITRLELFLVETFLFARTTDIFAFIRIAYASFFFRIADIVAFTRLTDSTIRYNLKG